MAKKILTVALNPSLDRTITVPKLMPGSLNRITAAQTDPGGKGVNVARVLHSFQADVTVMGFAAGMAGRQLLNFLHQAEISADFVMLEGETRTNLKVFDQQKQEITELNESGCPVSPEQLETFCKKYEVLCRDAGVVVLCGSLPPGVPKDIYARLVTMAKEQGVCTILDADGDALRLGLSAEPTAIKPNLQELQNLIGCTLPAPEAALGAVQKLLAGGVRLAVVSMGAQGAVLANDREAYRTRPWPVTAQSATGAGDSMVAALAWTLLEGRSLQDTAALVTAAGTVTATKPGTELCTMSEVMDAASLVSVQSIQPGTSAQ